MAAKSREETPKEGSGSSATAMQYMTLRRTNYKRHSTRPRPAWLMLLI
jgi:hypothetical protein